MESVDEKLFDLEFCLTNNHSFTKRVSEIRNNKEYGKEHCARDLIGLEFRGGVLSTEEHT